MTDSREKSRHRIPIASPLVYVLVGQYSLSLSLSLSLTHTHTHTHTSGTHTHTHTPFLVSLQYVRVRCCSR